MKKLLFSFAALALFASGSVFAMDSDNQSSSKPPLTQPQKKKPKEYKELKLREQLDNTRKRSLRRKKCIKEQMKAIKKIKDKSKLCTQVVKERRKLAELVDQVEYQKSRVNKTKIANVTGDAAIIGGGLGLGSYIKGKLDQGKTWKEILWEARKDKKAILSATLVTIGICSKTYSYLG